MPEMANIYGEVERRFSERQGIGIGIGTFLRDALEDEYVRAAIENVSEEIEFPDNVHASLMSFVDERIDAIRYDADPERGSVMISAIGTKDEESQRPAIFLSLLVSESVLLKALNALAKSRGLNSERIH